MGRPRQISDEQILTAMRSCVLARGPNVALEVVAKELAVSVPALLKRFGNRQKLMLAALRPPDEPEWIAEVARGPGEGPLERQLLEMFERIFAFMSRNAQPATEFFNLPPNRVVELGAQIEF